MWSSKFSTKKRMRQCRKITLVSRISPIDEFRPAKIVNKHKVSYKVLNVSIETIFLAATEA